MSDHADFGRPTIRRFIIEFLIITIGVLAVDNWNERRKEHLLVDMSFRRELADYYSLYDFHDQHHPEYRRKEAVIEEALLADIENELAATTGTWQEGPTC